jgi:hypothetical protein
VRAGAAPAASCEARAGADVRLSRGKSAIPLLLQGQACPRAGGGPADKYERAGTFGGEEGKICPSPSIAGSFYRITLVKPICSLCRLIISVVKMPNVYRFPVLRKAFAAQK